MGLLIAAGWVYGYVISNTGPGGLLLALIISTSMALLSWYQGDAIALATCGAVKINRREQFPTLWNVVENLAITAGIPKPKLYIVEDDAPNAFATGRDPQHASIAVTTGLLTRLNRTELEGVLAHELSHVKNYDSRVMMIAVVLVGAMAILGHYVTRFGMLGRSNRRNNDVGAVLFIIGLLFLVLSPIIGQLMQLAISRKREYLADASGALLTRYPEGLASALEKIQQANIPMRTTSSATNHLWIAAPTTQTFSSRIANLFSTHPPIDQRIARLRNMISHP